MQPLHRRQKGATVAEHQGHPSGTSQGSRGQSQGSQSELQNPKFRAINTHLTVCRMSVPKLAQRFFENVLFLFICLFQTTLLAPQSGFDWRTLTRPITSPLSLPGGGGGQGSRCTQTPKSLPTAGACSNSLRAGRPWALGLRLWTPGEGCRVEVVPRGSSSPGEPLCHLGSPERMHIRRVLRGERWPSLLPSPCTGGVCGSCGAVKHQLSRPRTGLLNLPLEPGLHLTLKGR